MIVIDASAMVDLLIDAGPNARWVEQAVASGGALAAPHLIDSELTSTLRTLARRGDLPASTATRALAEFRRTHLERQSITALLARIWQLREILTAYDGAYVVLAEVLRVPLVTTDRRLARSRGHRATILAPESG